MIHQQTVEEAGSAGIVDLPFLFERTPELSKTKAPQSGEDEIWIVPTLAGLALAAVGKALDE